MRLTLTRRDMNLDPTGLSPASRPPLYPGPCAFPYLWTALNTAVAEPLVARLTLHREAGQNQLFS